MWRTYGPISDEVLNGWLAQSDIATMILGADRVPLWMGRTRRQAIHNQFLALAVRDRGCVLCPVIRSRCRRVGLRGAPVRPGPTRYQPPGLDHRNGSRSGGPEPLAKSLYITLFVWQSSQTHGSWVVGCAIVDPTDYSY